VLVFLETLACQYKNVKLMTFTLTNPDGVSEYLKRKVLPVQSGLVLP
jgi:hypothetical protein